MDNFLLYTLAIITLLCFRAIFIKLLYPLINSPYFQDAAYHLKRIKMCKKDLFDRTLVDYVMDNRISYYPILYHQICSVLPIQLIIKYPWGPNLIFFLIGGIGFLAMSLIQAPEFESFEFASLLLFFFLISKSNMLFYGNGYHYLGLSERLFAKISNSFYTFSMFLFISTHNNLYIVLCLIFGILVFFSSQFGRQSLVLFSVCLSLLLLSLKPIIICLCTIALLLLIAPSVFFKSVYHWLEHLKTYFTYMQKSVFWVNHLSGFFKWEVFWSKRKEFKTMVFYIFNTEPCKSLLLIHSEFILLVFLVINKFITVSDHKLFFCFLLSAVLVSFLTSFKKLQFIGESYRYVEYNLYFLVPYYMAVFMMNNPLSLSVLLFYTLYVVVVSTVFNYMIKNIVSTHKYELVLAFLDNYKVTSSDCVATIDHTVNRLLNVFTGCKIFTFSAYYDKTLFKRFYGYQFPYLNNDHPEYFREYNVNLFIIEKNLLTISGLSYDCSSYQKDYEDEHFIVYKVV